MSHKYGKNLICDCCGIAVFLEEIEGFSHTYEDIPEGWTHRNDFGDMCPNCSRNYAKKMRDMFGYDKLPDQWRELII